MAEIETSSDRGASGTPLGAFAAAAERLVTGRTLDERLTALAEAAAAAVHADTVVIRLFDPDAQTLTVRAVVSSSPAVAAELERSRIPAGSASFAAEATADLPADLRRVADRLGAEAALVVPVGDGDSPIGTVELMRARRPFDDAERMLAELTAGQVALVAGAGANGQAEREQTSAPLSFVGEALAAATEGSRVEAVVARLAARASGAVAAVLWDVEGAGPPQPVARFGIASDTPLGALVPARADDGDRRAVLVEEGAEALPARATAVATVRLGEPAVSVLQLFLAAPPSAAFVDALAWFGARAGQAIRAGRRSKLVAAELERTRALLAVVGQATAELSLSHTLETAVDRVAELLGAERVAIYLREHGGLRPAAARGVEPGEVDIATQLLDLTLGPLRARGVLAVTHAEGDRRLAGVRESVRAAAVGAAVAVPLAVADDLIGLVVAYLERGRRPTEDETALLVALASQLGVAVQNARLHEEAKRLGAERARALEAEREAARRLRAFYEISQSFTRTLELDETLDALARATVELLGADAAVIRTHDRRRAVLVPHAVHAAEDRLEPAVTAILSRPHALEGAAGDRLLAQRKPTLLSPERAEALGEAYEVLVPFLAQGGTAALVPVGTAGELFATLTVVSLDAARPLDAGALETAASLAAHAVLALDNARLYEQQKHFLETMQHSLLPRALPDEPGLELGYVYESSARLEVGGDMWDYMRLPDGRLAVVLGDVAGHGVDVAADMAMAKFAFRALAREHPDPPDFLATANEVVVSEIALGKFITMVYLVLDGRTGALVGGSAGHPAPRLVRGGVVGELSARGVALGIEPGQRYEEVRTELAVGDAVVLYTDGVIEARREGEQYGEARLDAALQAHAALPARELAEAVVADCRAYAGELLDDCALVVVKRV